MKKVRFAEYGKANVLQLIETPTPEPTDQQILVKVEVAGINYSDILRRKNTYFMPTPLPYDLGVEAVGEVVQTGTQVPANNFPKGSRVLAILPNGGGYAEYVAVDAQYAVPLPPQISNEAATAIFVQGTTACLLLDQIVKDVKGKTLLIHAAAGGVGSLLVQLAKMQGATVVAAASSQAKLAKAQALGADYTINYTKENWTTELLDQTGGKKVDFIFEMVGGKIYEQCIETLRPGGSIVVYGAASGEQGMIHSERFVDEGQNLLSFNLALFIQHHTELWQQALGKMINLLAQDKIKIEHPHIYPLEKVVTAHSDIEQRLTSGKVILVNN